jgi:DNA-binding SARP family transcriptional activator/tetratricopeptide (TPR) repeat protein
VEVEGAQLAEGLRGKQVPLLLAYLVLNRSRQVGREELIDVLWPFQPPRSEDAALRTLLSRLRSALGSDSLAGRDGLMLALPEPVWVDVEAAGVEVQRAQQALEGGDARTAWALAQVPLNIASRGLLPGSQARWLEPRRRELEDVRLQALEVIGRAGLSVGGTQLASVERAARNLIETEPYRESGYILLMEALAAQGNVAEGLRIFDRLRTLLRDELGAMPSPEAMAVHEALLNPAGRAAEPSAAREDDHQALALPPELVARGGAPLVGRRRELGELESLWAVACRDEPPAEGEGPSALDPLGRPGRVTLLTGDPGIGKTRLAAELALRVHAEGAFVLAGRAPEETLAPYQPFLEALRHYVTGAPLGELRLTVREYGTELARLVPDLRRRVPDLPPPGVDEPETERYRLFEAVVGLLSVISASAPILLVLDDLQWADRPTLLLLRHLARAPNPRRLLILGAYRPTETERDGFSEALADLRRERLVTEVAITGLSEEETGELVRARTNEVPSRAFSAALHQETEGNPLFIEEIVRHLLEGGVHAAEATPHELQRFGLPEGVKQVIAQRLDRMGAQAIESLRVAAVVGRDFDAALLEQVVSLDEDEFLDALDEALAAGLVVEAGGQPGRYSFSHALIRETLYEAMSAPRRARVHRRVGEALESARRESLPSLALHFTRAAGPHATDKAIAYALRAADEATAMLAHEEAVEHYSRALEVLDRFEPDAIERRCELLVLLGDARVRSGERPLAWPAYREAATLAERLGDSGRLARAAIGASRGYILQPGVVDTELIAMLERALELIGDEPSTVRVRLLSRLCGAVYYTGQQARMLALSEEAWAIATEIDDSEARTYACAARRRALWDPAHLRERLTTSTEMLTSARRAGNLELELQAHAWLLVDLLSAGDREAVDAQLEAFTTGAERLRQPLYLWNVIVWRAMCALLAGRLEQAERLAESALATGGPGETVTAPQYYAIQMLGIRREQDRMPELEDAARRVVEANPARPAWRAGLAIVLEKAERPELAREQLEILAARDFADIPRDADWLAAVTLISDVAVALADSARAALLYDLLLPYGEQNVVIGLASVCLGSVARYLGRLAVTAGRPDAAEEHFKRAIGANTALRAPVELAHTQLDYARILGSGARARQLIEAARKAAAELELPAVARRVAELGAAPAGRPG